MVVLCAASGWCSLDGGGARGSLWLSGGGGGLTPAQRKRTALVGFGGGGGAFLFCFFALPVRYSTCPGGGLRWQSPWSCRQPLPEHDQRPLASARVMRPKPGRTWHTAAGGAVLLVGALAWLSLGWSVRTAAKQVTRPLWLSLSGSDKLKAVGNRRKPPTGSLDWAKLSRS